MHVCMTVRCNTPPPPTPWHIIWIESVGLKKKEKERVTTSRLKEDGEMEGYKRDTGRRPCEPRQRRAERRGVATKEKTLFSFPNASMLIERSIFQFPTCISFRRKRKREREEKCRKRNFKIRNCDTGRSIWFSSFYDHLALKLCNGPNNVFCVPKRVKLDGI